MNGPTPPVTAAGPRHGMFSVDADRAIEALRLAWGTAYDLGFGDGAWHVCRLETGMAPSLRHDAR